VRNIPALILGLTICGALHAQTPATPPRGADGLLTGSVTPMAKTPANEAERIALVEANLKARRQLEAKHPPPLGAARRVPENAITVDGKLDEAAWQTAAEIAGFRGTRDGAAAKHATRVRFAWDDKNLYVAAECDDPVVAATIEQRDGELWREDAFEVFIDPSGAGTDYIELEVSPRNVQHDAVLADYRPEVNWITDLAHLDLTNSPKVYDAAGFRSAVQVRGTLNKNDDTDQGWTVELAISWDDIRRGANTRRLPPVEGDVWRIGVFRINADKDPAAAEFTAWNPSTSWFHVPWAYGHVLFLGEKK
jgi:hypothetical protein